MDFNEVETKVLAVDEAAVKTRLNSLGATLVQDVLLAVDWYRDPKATAEADEWYLRIRTSSNGLPEVTWKSKAARLSTARRVREVSFQTEHAAEMSAIFTGIGLELYAHQDKYRTSWTYQDWRFDLDKYPGVEPFLEIEGKSDQHVLEAITLLGLTKNQTYNDGERTLMEDVYHVDWYEMRFAKIYSS